MRFISIDPKSRIFSNVVEKNVYTNLLGTIYDVDSSNPFSISPTLLTAKIAEKADEAIENDTFVRGLEFLMLDNYYKLKKKDEILIFLTYLFEFKEQVEELIYIVISNHFAESSITLVKLQAKLNQALLSSDIDFETDIFPLLIDTTTISRFLNIVDIRDSLVKKLREVNEVQFLQLLQEVLVLPHLIKYYTKQYKEIISTH